MDAPAYASIRRRRSAASPRRRVDSRISAIHEQRGLDADALFSWRDDNGTEHFSFPQQVWLYPDVHMRTTPSYSRSAEVLAINILAFVLQERDYPAWGGFTSRRAVGLAKRFFDECLTDLPADGWRIDFDTLEDWIMSCEDKGRRR